MPVSTRSKLQLLAAAFLTLAGFALMAVKIYADSEPGGIPILLVVLGVAWLLVTRARSRTKGT